MAKLHDAGSLSDRSVGIRLSVFYAALFLSAGLYLPYWPVWLASRGLGPVEIGLIFASGRFASVVSGPVIAHIADRRGDRRRPLLVLAGSTMLIFSLYALAGPFWHYVLVAIGAGAAWGTIMPLADSLAIVNAQRRRIQYGRVRLWGSVSFIFATLAGGKALEWLPDSAIFWVLLVSFSGIVVAGFLLPDTRVEGVPIRFRALLGLFANPVFLLFLLVSALLQSSHQAVYIFGTLHWRAIGIESSTIGALWAVGVVAEVALFAFGAKLLNRMGAGRMMVLAAVAGLIRWPILATATTLPVLFATQILHALTFGATHLAAMAFIAQAIPNRLSATAQSLHGTVALGLAFVVVARYLGGFYVAEGGGVFYAMTALSLAGGIGALILMRCWKGEALFK
jgi:PPP family 3-phenylpropionic acid transporter